MHVRKYRRGIGVDRRELKRLLGEGWLAGWFCTKTRGSRTAGAKRTLTQLASWHYSVWPSLSLSSSWPQPLPSSTHATLGIQSEPPAEREWERERDFGELLWPFVFKPQPNEQPTEREREGRKSRAAKLAKEKDEALARNLELDSLGLLNIRIRLNAMLLRVCVGGGFSLSRCVCV